MTIATSRIEVGIRDLKNNLSRYIDRVGKGTEIIVTDYGRPVARLVKIDASTNRLADLIDAGIVHAAPTRSRSLPKRVSSSSTISDLAAEQRR